MFQGDWKGKGGTDGGKGGPPECCHWKTACGADQHHGQDRHEAGAADFPDGPAAAAQGPFFFVSLAVVACCVTLAEKPILFSAGQLHRPLPQHRRAWHFPLTECCCLSFGMGEQPP